MANRGDVVIRVDRMNEVQRKFPEFIDRVLREGATEIKQKGDSAKPSKIPSSIFKERTGYIVGWGNRQFFFGPFVEFGTVYQRARPFATPAAESVFPRLKRTLSNLEKAL
jgi:hypothetical protein